MTNLDGWVRGGFSKKLIFYQRHELHGRVSIVKLGSGEQHSMSIELTRFAGSDAKRKYMVPHSKSRKSTFKSTEIQSFLIFL